MKKLNNLEVSNKIFDLVNDDFRLHPTKPMTFYVVNSMSQHKAYIKIMEVCDYLGKKFGSEWRLVEDYGVFVAFEITEPVCANLELFMMKRDGIEEL